MRLTKKQIQWIGDFIGRSVKLLQNSHFTCSCYDLDKDLAIYVGWAGGYDAGDNSCIHSRSNKTYCLNVGIKIRNNYDWSDYESLKMPILNDNSGEIYDTGISISSNEDYYKLARYLIKDYDNIKRLLKANKITLDF